MSDTKTEISEMSVGLLGWSATMYTPIAAYILLDSWKNQIKYSAILEQITILIEELSNLSLAIETIRKDKSVFSYLYSMYLGFEKFNQKNHSFNIPNFDEAYLILERIRVSNLKIYILDEKMNTHIFEKSECELDEFNTLENMIKGLEASFYDVKYHSDPIDKGINNKDDEIFLQRCLYINGSFANSYRNSILPEVENIYLKQLNDSLKKSFEKLKAFRKKLK